MEDVQKTSHRKTQAAKNSNDFQWYKDQGAMLDHGSSNSLMSFGNVTEYRRMKTNYDLFNNIINNEDFAYVCKPYGADTGELPAQFTNRDIVSGKIKVLLGMEMKMPFSWKVTAVNREATTRREQEETKRLKEFVTGEIMTPIRTQIEQEAAAANAGKELTPEQQQEIAAQIQEQLKAATPDEVRKYMQREHQDPAEIMASQLLEYLLLAKKANRKFNLGFKHLNISAVEAYWVGILNGEPDFRPVNPLFFEFDNSPDLENICYGQWAKNEMRLTPSQIITDFGDVLTEKQVDKIYDGDYRNGSPIRDSDFTFDTDRMDEGDTRRVMHYNFKSLRKVGFLTYFDPQTGGEEMKIVDETYKLNKKIGDISIEWEWIPESHECYQIMDDIWVHCRPVPGQHKDIDNIWECKLSYHGATLDNLNSPMTSPMDRMKYYQYLLDVIVYRIELLMASDKGKILAMNINAVPKSLGINLEKFHYYMEASKVVYLNPNEEGNKMAGDVTNLVKEIDMSLASDIKQYMDMAEYVERKCGQSIGITPQMEAQIGANEAVGNTQQNLINASHIIQPFFELHNNVKGDVLLALLETAKTAYADGGKRVLNYVLDDMSYKMLTLDPELLDSSTYGLFISNSAKAMDAKRAVEQLAHAAMQTQQADLGDIIKVIRSESVTEAEELLEIASDKKADQANAAEKMKIKAQERTEQKMLEMQDRKFEQDKELIVLKEKERRETEIQKQTILTLGFNEDKDVDKDGTPDALEVAKFGVDAGLKRDKQSLDSQKFDHQKKMDEEKLKQTDEKLRLDEKKIAAQAKKPKN